MRNLGFREMRWAPQVTEWREPGLRLSTVELQCSWSSPTTVLSSQASCFLWEVGAPLFFHFLPHFPNPTFWSLSNEASPGRADLWGKNPSPFAHEKLLKVNKAQALPQGAAPGPRHGVWLLAKEFPFPRGDCPGEMAIWEQPYWCSFGYAFCWFP